MTLDERQARAVLEKAIRLSKAEACTVRLDGSSGGNIRYARNTVTTAGAGANMSLGVGATFGKRTGGASTNELDDAAIERTMRRAEELARLAPEDPETMDLLGPQTYTPTPAHFQRTADITAGFRADVAAAGIGPAKARDCAAAGFLRDSEGFTAMLNSKGLFGYHRTSGMDFSLTVRTSDGTGSGYVARDFNDVAKFDPAAVSAIAIEKAVASRNPRAIEPGKYTVVIEPEAGNELLGFMMGFDARNADEGRSYLSAAGGGTRLGQKLVDQRVTIYSDPTHPEVPATPWGFDGLPRNRTVWIDKGVVQNLSYSRYWAAQQGKEPLPGPANIIMEGGTQSLEELVRGTERGILVTRFWYIRSVDRQTVLATGLTRDGTFYVENGQIRHAVKNFRFNESPVIMLNNLDALGRPMRVQGNLIPAMRVRDFTFTSLSDAI
jgi:predicted Zn-dependent protease